MSTLMTHIKTVIRLHRNTTCQMLREMLHHVMFVFNALSVKYIIFVTSRLHFVKCLPAMEKVQEGV